MGDLTWLQTLGVALGTGLISTLFWTIRQIVKGNLVPKATLDREKQISARWREIAEMYADNDRRRSVTVERNNQILGRVLAVLERAPWAGTAPVPGSPGYGGSVGIRLEPTRSPPPPWS
jgi:hypothetical protein